MTYMMGFGLCWSCQRPFGFNPDLVPSFKGEPICETCIRQANEIREREGRPLWPILPGAYEPEEV